MTNPNTLPSFQVICTRRTRGHYPETFRAVDFPPSQCNNVAYFTAQSSSFLRVLFVLFLLVFLLHQLVS